MKLSNRCICGYQGKIDRLEAELAQWRDIANCLGTHMGEALYGEDDWPCREYAISAYSVWEHTDGAALYKYEVEPKPKWYFRKGETV